MILITGATGTVGRPLIELLSSGGADVRAVTRKPRAAALPADVEVVEGDPSRPGTLTSALREVATVFVNPAAVGNATGEFLTLAREHATERVVLLSALAVDEGEPDHAIATHHQSLEDTVTGCGLEWVILRPGMFAANALFQWATQTATADVVRGPYALSTDAPIHERDIAEVAARALRTDELVGRRIPLTGPQSLTRQEMVRILGEVIGRALRYEEIPPEAARQGMLAHGVPEPLVDATLTMQARSVGKPATITREVQTILGRPARTFAEWVADHADAFRN